MRQSRTTAEWVDLLETAKIGCGPSNKLSQVFADPHVIAREVVIEMAHASGETIKVANPVRLSATPARYDTAPPLLGQHTDEVLNELGLDQSESPGCTSRVSPERTGARHPALLTRDAATRKPRRHLKRRERDYEYV